MEDWEYELERARKDGHAQAVKGFKKILPQVSAGYMAVGYHTHRLDLMDALERIGSQRLTDLIMAELEETERMRIDTDNFIYPEK